MQHNWCFVATSPCSSSYVWVYTKHPLKCGVLPSAMTRRGSCDVKEEMTARTTGPKLPMGCRVRTSTHTYIHYKHNPRMWRVQNQWEPNYLHNTHEVFWKRDVSKDMEQFKTTYACLWLNARLRADELESQYTHELHTAVNFANHKPASRMAVCKRTPFLWEWTNVTWPKSS